MVIQLWQMWSQSEGQQTFLSVKDPKVIILSFESYMWSMLTFFFFKKKKYNPL